MNQDWDGFCVVYTARMNYVGTSIFGLVFFLLAVILYLAVILGFSWLMVWFLTPVAYRRWKKLKDQDERRGQ